MAARALASRGRLVIAAVLLAGVLAVLLGAWGLTGWHDVRARQGAAEVAPIAAASARAGELARALRGELEQMVARETKRPYFHYQNLFHDPRASAGPSVTPSPLATGSEDLLVAGYFQIDADAHVTTPAINDEFPQLSEAKHLVENRAFRDAVAQQFAHTLAPERAPRVLVAEAAPRPRHVPVPVAVPVVQTETVEIDSSSYTQNWNANAVYGQQLPHVERAPVPPVPPVAPVTPQKPRAPAPPVIVTISALEWRTLPFTTGPALVATRAVQTPDGNFTQGFVVDRAALTHWLADHAGDLVAELRTTGHAEGASELVPGWAITVAPNPRTVAAAATDAAQIATTFLVRFVAVGAIALVAALLVIWLVARAERYARERSQFAAAAAHELRTPLAGLQLYGDMLADGLGDPAKLRDYAKRMSEEASRLGRVVSNVLGFSQLERGNLSIDPQPGNVAAALRELVEHVEPTFDRAGAMIALTVPEELAARFDRDALARVIGNLLDNSEKYTRGAEDRTIELAAARVGEGESARIEITVRDHGAGVTDPAKLFQAFARGVATDGPAGLGLGLALSRSLARAMGGDLDYRASADGGAIFVVRLST